MSENTARKRASIVRRGMIYLVPLLLFALVLTGVEGLASLANHAAGEPVWPVLLDVSELLRARGTIRQEGGTQTLSFLDPHLGYEHEYGVLSKLGDGYLPGFVIYGDQKNTSALRIVALGGSTTDPVDKDNWPRKLHAILDAKGVKNVVFNGGVSGFSSNQDLLKLIRDALPLKPDIVLALEGVNDAGFVHSVDGHPMVHPYQERMLMELRGQRGPIVMPNTMRAWQRWRKSRSPGYNRVGGVNYGPAVETTDVAQWERNVGLMRACAAQQKIRFYPFLQPVLGIGDYAPSARESALLDDAKKMFGGQYLNKLGDFYTTARKLCKDEGAAIDLSEIYAGKTDLYRDARHPNAEGYRIVAQTIADAIAVTKP